jgi:mannan endo-1,4-beta-mannosidase
MRARLVMLAAGLIAAASVAFAITLAASSAPPRPVWPSVARAALPSRLSSYLGVYAAGTPHTYQSVAHFARATGRQPNLVGYYSGWREPFATSFAETVRRHGGIPILQIDPTYASVPKIAAGGYDGYLRSFADSVRDFRHAVVIGFGHEMNAPWYSWGYGHVKASTFVAAWRHIVSLFRVQGAGNVTWLWTINQDLKRTGPVVSWWPGARYVTWVGIDGYYYRPSDTFASVFGTTIAQVRTFTSKPVLLSETAVGPGADQAVKIRDLFTGMHDYQTLGLVWFDITQHQGIYHQDWRVEDQPTAETAFRTAASALTLARP